MEWLNKMKDRLSKKRIQDLDQFAYKRDFVDLEVAKTVGMIVNVTESNAEDLDLIRTYADALRKRNKKVLLIELNFDKKSTPKYPNSLFINPAKLNWYEYPVPSMEKKIQQYDLDILMNFDSSERMTSKYICSVANARTRTGIHIEGLESCYELMIEQTLEDNEEGVSNMIKQFDYFLNMIEK